MRLFFPFLLALSLLLSACSAPASSPAKSAAAYLQALNTKDAAGLSALSCASWEAQALSTLDSFQAVSTQLQGLSCLQTGSDDQGQALVTCQGQLIASYSGEPQQFDLSLQEYVLNNESGDWLVCEVR